ncbi:MAG TPA: hypothetical protein VFT41_13330 [Gemmatimonadaceae bacterium]|nr:hypothetical protein [Gemmatimonadaceae bacterium]
MSSATKSRRRFSWRRDFGRVRWSTTAWVNLLRGVAAGVVWGLVWLVVTRGRGGGRGGLTWWSLPAVAVAAYAGFTMVFLPAARAIAVRKGDRGSRLVRRAAFLCGLPIAVGDPLVYALRRKWPRAVAETPMRPFNATLVLFVLNRTDGTERWWYR